MKLDGMSFGQVMKIRSAKDEFALMTLEELESLVPVDVQSAAAVEWENRNEIDGVSESNTWRFGSFFKRNVLKWVARGMSAADAVRKVRVDQTVFMQQLEFRKALAAKRLEKKEAAEAKKKAAAEARRKQEEADATAKKAKQAKASAPSHSLKNGSILDRMRRNKA